MITKEKNKGKRVGIWCNRKDVCVSVGLKRQACHLFVGAAFPEVNHCMSSCLHRFAARYASHALMPPTDGQKEITASPKKRFRIQVHLLFPIREGDSIHQCLFTLMFCCVDSGSGFHCELEFGSVCVFLSLSLLGWTVKHAIRGMMV